MKKTLYCLLSGIFVALSSIHSTAQIITTICGSSTTGYTGDGFAAGLAETNGPHGVTTDVYGNIYFADHYNNCVREILTSGIIKTIAGNGTPGFSGDGTLATSAEMNQPFGVTVDAHGNIYIGDTYNNRVRMVNPSGIISTIAGTGVAGFSGDGTLATTARLNAPYGVAVDTAGNIYIGDGSNSRVRKIAAGTGIITTIAGNGIAGYGGDLGPATSAKLYVPSYLNFDAAGNLYITDNANHRIRKVDLSGTITTVAGNGTGGFGGDGGLATAAEINYPGGIALDKAGNLYITDYLNNRIRVVNASGIISTIAGGGVPGYSGDGGLATLAELYQPTDVAVDTNGNVYIADFFNNRLRKITMAPNHKPMFTGGHSQTIGVCENSLTASINTNLAVNDIDTGQTEHWSVLTPPVHGSLVAYYTTTSTGATLNPTGQYYTPATGFIGMDSFQVMVSDGMASDTTTVHVNVNPFTAGVITGPDSVCVGASIILTDTIHGGLWSSTDSASVASDGIVTGIHSGMDTIVYTVFEDCGIISTFFHVYVLDASHCSTGIKSIDGANAGRIEILPNPNNGTFIFNLSSDKQEEMQITVTNVIGDKVTEKVSKTNAATDMALNVPPGIYFISATTANGKWSAKFVVTH